MHIDHYHSYSELAEHEVEGTDFTITVFRRPFSAVAVIAPHGGKIEPRTSEIARAIAGEDFNLYLFEGIKKRGNYAALHITSRRERSNDRDRSNIFFLRKVTLTPFSTHFPWRRSCVQSDLRSRFSRFC